jgi:hypothetical protein
MRERRGTQMARRSGRGWSQQRNTPYLVLGTLVTVAAVLIVAILMLPGPGGLASATASPTTAASEVAVASATPSPPPTSTPEITPAPTPEVTPEITLEVTPELTLAPSTAPSGSPSASSKPSVDSLSLQSKADCNHDYGYGSPGFIKITWTSTGTTGVRISIDPPSPATAYGAGYRDEPPDGSDWVPFTCGSASHLYVVTTLHTSGYYQYRYQKVTQSPAATP